jgi:hypothetical protein
LVKPTLQLDGDAFLQVARANHLFLLLRTFPRRSYLLL